MNGNKKYLIIFGAGASFGSGEVNPKPPPMTAGLLQALTRLFPSCWGNLPQELVDCLKEDFEAGVKKVSEVNSHLLPPLQRAMASFFFGFTPGEDNLYRRLAKKVLNANWSGAFVTLNYERLLEVSLGAEGLKPFAGERPGGENYVEICFPHGCCHIFCDSVRASAEGVSFSGFNISTSGQISVVANPSEFNNRIRNDAFPPVMSYFEPDKRTSSGSNFIEAQRTRYIELVNGADIIVIIGLRVRENDKHIWDVISGTSARVVYCSGERGCGEFLNWSNKNRGGKDNKIIKEYFDKAFDSICKEVGLE